MMEVSMIVKQKCPNCGKMVNGLWTWKKPFDSCEFCNPNIKGRSVGQVLGDIQNKRKTGDRKRK